MQLPSHAGAMSPAQVKEQFRKQALISAVTRVTGVRVPVVQGLGIGGQWVYPGSRNLADAFQNNIRLNAGHQFALCRCPSAQAANWCRDATTPIKIGGIGRHLVRQAYDTAGHGVALWD
jgi:hypothetical protein